MPLVDSSAPNPCGGRRGAALSIFNRDGSPRWSIELPASEPESQVPPLVDHDVIFSGQAGSVSAVRVADGTVEWKQPLGEIIYTLWLTDGLLVANVDQASGHAKIVGLDPATGARRWTYQVPGGGFVGDAVLTGDGGLAFRTGDAGTLTVIDTSSGDLRWSRPVGDRGSADALPSAGSGLVLYVDADEQVIALDSRTGSPRWQAPAGVYGRVVVSGNVGVVVPDVTSGPTVTVVAHSLDDGAELWRRKLADISGVYPDQAGFLLLDYRANTMTLVRATGGTQLWQAQLRKIDDLDHPPISLSPDDALAVPERSAVAFVDRSSGDVQQLPAQPGGGARAAAAGQNGLVLASDTQVRLVTATGVSWTAQLPHYTQTAPAALDDGGVAVESEDPICAHAD
jgi:outer membrane protein assembly factor BamB